MAASFTFTLNGAVHTVAGVAPTTTVLQWLRAHGLTGTKEGCAEGDCGACTLALVEEDHHGKTTYRAINSCITLLPMIAGREIVTVEGLADGDRLHPVQAAMVEHLGSQCGYCTPGFVMTMFEGFHRPPLDRPQMADQLCGNLCRCTGYRPIRDAMIACESLKRSHRDRHHAPLERPVARPDLAYEHAGERFLRPGTLDELLRLRAAHPDAVLVAGATEVGVELNKKARPFPFLISTEGVAELRRVERTERAFVVGGAATLTALEEAIGDELPMLRKMLLVFASRQIRSRATLAGNLVTASPIGDMAPVLLAVDADIVLASARGERTLPLSDFFLGYRKTAIAPDEIVKSVVIPHTFPEGTLLESYKVSKRRELDISIVAAAFRVLVKDGVIAEARLAYGGVAATPVRARRAEAFLVGKPATDATALLASGVLDEELSPISDARSGAPYRKGLAGSLLRKLVLGETSLAQDAPLDFVPGTAWAAPTPSRDLRHDSGPLHVSGRARYTDDEPAGSEAYVLWPIRAAHAHATLTSIDATAARGMPGVALVLLADDVPGLNDVGAIRHDEPLFAKDTVSFHGQVIGAVIARSYKVARAAAEAVRVEYQVKPPVLGVRAAVAAGSFHTQPHVIRRGDVAKALAEAPHVLSGDLDIGGQEHFYLEAHAALVQPEDDGSLHVVSSTQHPSEVQAILSHVLHLPRHRITVESPRMGGGFGGKETQAAAWAAMAAIAAVRLGAPVRVQLDRDLDMQLSGKRHPFLGEYEAGFDAEGRLLALRAKVTSDGGWALDLSESIADRALFHLDNGYFIPHFHGESRVARTNAVSHTAFRGFGGPQGMVVIEEVLDRIARTLGLAPEVVRERNLYRGAGETNTTPYGQELADERLPALFRHGKDRAALVERRREIAAWNAAHPHVKRGIALTPVKFGISFTATFLNQAGALVLVYRDGTVQVNHGGTEMGQGLYTKLQGVAMRELGLPADVIRVMKTRTDKVPNTSATAASSGSDLNGQAVRAACDTLKERLATVARTLLGDGEVRFEDGRVHVGAKSAPFAEVVERAYLNQVSLAATGFYRTPDIGYDRTVGKGRPFYYFAYGVAVSEVEVDGLSGMKRLLRADLFEDVGESLNPHVDRGQIEGGFVQGVGWLTGEELSWDAEGRLLTHSASTYQIPAVSDAPIDLRVELLANAAQPGVIHGSKAVGEPPLMLAISVREALRDAIAQFGAPGGEVRLACPATHEAIFHAVRARL